MDPKIKGRNRRALVEIIKMDKNSILNFNVIKNLETYKKTNSLTNEDLEEKLTNIAVNLFCRDYIDWWTASKVGKVLRGERSISSIEDRQTISYLLTQNTDNFSKIIFNDEKDVINFLAQLIDNLKEDKKVFIKASNFIKSGYSGYITGLNKIQNVNSNLIDFKVAFVLESIRTYKKTKDIKRLYINSLNKAKMDLIDSKKVNITPNIINKFRNALPIEGSSLTELKKIGYKFLIVNISGFTFL